MASVQPNPKFVPSVLYHGHRVRASGGKVYFRPPTETLHEFLYLVLRITFGEEWWREQQSLTNEKQHVVVKWSDAVNAWLAANKTDQNKVRDGLWSVQVSGYAQSLLQLSFDVFCLQQVDRLPEALIGRLRDKAEFQGVRYEIGVASIFARAGFVIDYCQPVHGEMICEFVARHPAGQNVAVEAKSRKRPGILGFKGTPSDEFRADLKKPYAKARKKKPSLPFVIFLDANLPPTPEVPWEDSPRLQDLKEMFEEFPSPTPEQPDPHNMVVITNYGFYYEGDGPSKTQPPLYILSQYPKHAMNHPAVLTAIQAAIEKYTVIPNEL